METWKKINTRFAGLSLREKGIVLFGILASMFMLSDTFFFDPVRIQQKRAAQEEVNNLSQIAQLQPQLLEIARARALDPDAQNLKRAAEIRSRGAELEQKIRQQSAQLIEPHRMSDVLKRLLADRPGVSLVGMKTLPQQTINLGSGGDESAAGAQVATGAGAQAAPAQVTRPLAVRTPEAAAPQPLLYRNGMQLVLRGNFLELLAYLRDVEKLPVQIYWDKLELSVVEFPVSQLTLVVNTIGLDQAWLKI